MLLRLSNAVHHWWLLDALKASTFCSPSMITRYQSWAHDITATTTWPCFQDNKLLLFKLYVCSLQIFHLDTNALPFFKFFFVIGAPICCRVVIVAKPKQCCVPSSARCSWYYKIWSCRWSHTQAGGNIVSCWQDTNIATYFYWHLFPYISHYTDHNFIVIPSLVQRPAKTFTVPNYSSIYIVMFTRGQPKHFYST